MILLSLPEILHLFLLVTLAVAQVPTGCGGFIKPSAQLAKVSSTKMDYSVVNVKLVTLEGATKDKTECAPTGYYFLPIYDKGDYVIKIEGPEGWNFEPRETAIHIGEDNRCTATSGSTDGEDINFSLSGFGIKGKVIGENCQQEESEGGPSGVTVTLTNNDGAKDIKTITDKGLYNFDNIFPGTYKLKASHPDWSLSNSEYQVTVTWGTVKVPTDFVVSGYDVSGKVTSKDEPVLGVDFLLYSDVIKSVPCASSPSVPANKKPPLCVARSDDTGRFLFKNLPCGTYKLVPYYKGANTTFDVIPAEKSVVVARGSTVLKDVFQVMGFSLSGRVVSQGKGVPDVVIKVDGKEKSQTDSNGYYKLDQLTSGVYNIDASKEHIFFNPLTNYRVSPNIVALHDITVKSYHLCGRVYVAQPSVSGTRSRAMILLSETEKEITRVNTDQSGQFCFEVEPGNYKVSPQITAEEEAAGLLLNPRLLKVSVSNAPVLDIGFNQAKVTVSGRVKCIESPCDSSISLSLYSESSQSRVTTGLGVLGAIPSGRDGDSFLFRDVFPGSYKVTVNRDSWCWEKDVFEIEVKTEDINNLEFVHSGYQLTVKSSHQIDLLFDPEVKTEQKNFSLTKGLNKFCVPRPGLHTLRPSSCYRFEQEAYKYDTTSPKVVELTALLYLVKGIIQVQNPSSEDNLKVTISKGDTVDPDEATVQLTTQKQGSSSYEYSYWGKLGDSIEIIPSSSKLLFYPPTRSLSIHKSECQPLVETFEARPGLFLEGSTSPPIVDVRITVSLTNTAQKLKEVYTTSKGTFAIGPLYDDQEYKLDAEKEGYKFTLEGKSHFKALRLSRLSVNVKDQDSNLVTGVLLSLSGNSYRNNNVTQNGSFTFANLFPGDYYLKPLLKEYVFEPSSQTITVIEGEDSSISFTAQRTAFSCYGTTRSLNGEPEKLVTIEALGPKGEYEETQSDINGTFRLRGLLPNQQYKISIKQGENDRIERASPSSFTMQVGKQDIHNVDFVVFRRSNRYDVTGIVKTDTKWVSSLNVTLHKEGDSSPVQSIGLGPSQVFEFSSLAKGRYSIQVHSTLSPQIYIFDAPHVPIEVQNYGSHVELNFTASLKQEAQPITSTPILALFLAAAVIVGVFYNEAIIAFISSARNGELKKKSVPIENTSTANDDWIAHLGPKKPKNKSQQLKLQHL